MIRSALDDDLPSIEALARARFVRPGWLFELPANLAHYRPGYERAAPDGVLHAVVCETAAGLAGYAFYHVRPGGDTYLRELAAAVSGVGTGTRLLAAVAAHAIGPGPARLTANVMASHREADPDWRDPTPFYLRRGFRVAAGEAGYAAGGAPRSPHDTWLVADARTVLAACRRRLPAADWPERT
jgi:hypothetical protein